MATAKRTQSEETEIRGLLVKLTDHVLELKADQAANNKVIAARLDDLEREARLHHRQQGELKSEVGAVAILANDTLKKTTELHNHVLGATDKLGKRLHDLEQERTKRGSASVTSRPPRRR